MTNPPRQKVDHPVPGHTQRLALLSWTSEAPSHWTVAWKLLLAGLFLPVWALLFEPWPGPVHTPAQE